MAELLPHGSAATLSYVYEQYYRVYGTNLFLSPKEMSVADGVSLIAAPGGRCRQSRRSTWPAPNKDSLEDATASRNAPVTMRWRPLPLHIPVRDGSSRRITDALHMYSWHHRRLLVHKMLLMHHPGGRDGPGVPPESRSGLRRVRRRRFPSFKGSETLNLPTTHEFQLDQVPVNITGDLWFSTRVCTGM